MNVIKLLLITTLTTIIPGQIIRLGLFSSNAITLTDISVAATVVFFFLYALILRKPLIFPKKIFLRALIFFLIALASTVLAVNNFLPREVAVSSFFLTRFIFYFFLAVVTASVIRKEKIDKWLNILQTIGIIFALIGILQFILIPDLSFLTAYGWDPHIDRLASSLIDPNFSGGLLVLFFSLSLSLYLYKRNLIHLGASMIFFTSIILTFSRSSYLALLAATLTIGLVKSPKIIFITALLFAFILIASPKAQSRIVGAFSLDETATARIESWQNAVSIFASNPILGVGFNTYRFAQEQSGVFSFDNPQGGHSGAGSDSSILLVAATTGTVGLVSFLLLLLTIIKAVVKNIKSDYLALGLSAGFIALLIHSQFVNSLFYPQIMVIVWFLVGLKYAKDN